MSTNDSRNAIQIRDRQRGITKFCGSVHKFIRMRRCREKREIRPAMKLSIAITRNIEVRLDRHWLRLSLMGRMFRHLSKQSYSEECRDRII